MIEFFFSLLTLTTILTIAVVTLVTLSAAGIIKTTDYSDLSKYGIVDRGLSTVKNVHFAIGSRSGGRLFPILEIT